MQPYQKEALKLAKRSILEEFDLDNLEGYIPNLKELEEEKSCFVTLRKDKSLRGCIGNIFPIRKLYEDIIGNAKSAAFEDPRFSSLTKYEIENSDSFYLDITILSPIQEIEFISPKELIEFLNKKRPGLVLKLGYKKATFLPSVWEELKKPEDFLTHLLYKASITGDEFKNHFNEMEFAWYEGEEFGNEWDKID
ncbi:MAG: AmmeMemoRadiSam system protein A [Candidatus Gracilibacteria bacterium]|nr:AmmeMemoRadiSam system protein A [Candidatus Gracilibacteria bacterium]MDD3120444.1 AmmeMemoRadiSam system protein A [Candidatus Gracilibacteria bacterium]MDD4530926.1 AmmeMemoRadiSam system protein A [Candidatus Gracilibacteria bacterium]